MKQKLRLARVSAVTVKDDEILIPCFPLLKQGNGQQGARMEFISKNTREHSMMTIAYDLMQKGLDLDEIKKLIPNKWTAEQIGEYIAQNGKVEFSER